MLLTQPKRAPLLGEAQDGDVVLIPEIEELRQQRCARPDTPRFSGPAQQSRRFIECYLGRGLPGPRDDDGRGSHPTEVKDNVEVLIHVSALSSSLNPLGTWAKCSFCGERRDRHSAVRIATGGTHERHGTAARSARNRG